MSTPGKFIAAGAAGGDPTVIVATSGNLSMLVLTNTATAIRRVKFYDKATAPTSSDTPKQVYELPAASASSVAGMVVPIPSEGLDFDVGISFRIVTGQADNDNTAATAGEVVMSYATR